MTAISLRSNEPDRRGSRRQFLSRLANVATAAAAVAAIPGKGVLAAYPSLPPLPPQRALSFHSLHTGERLTATYFAGAPVPKALAEIDHILRDWRTGDVTRTDRRLLDLLFSLRRKLGGSGPIEIISAYRSPKTNAHLATKSQAVAKRSFHMRGMAVDVRLPGCELKALHRVALELEAGGVGLYSKSGFVHLDTGRVRRWGK